MKSSPAGSARAQRGQIGARVGLGKAPAPDLIGVDNAGQKGGVFALPDLNEKVARAERCSRINGRQGRPSCYLIDVCI